MRLYAQMLHKVNLGLKRSYTSRDTTKSYSLSFFKGFELERQSPKKEIWY